MRASLKIFLGVIILGIVACQVKAPFLKKNSIALRAPASLAKEVFQLKMQFEEGEVSLFLSLCQDLRSLRFNLPFLEKKDLSFDVRLKHFGCLDQYEEKISYKSSLMTDKFGPIKNLCASLLHGSELPSPLEHESTAKIRQFSLFKNPLGQRVLSVLLVEKISEFDYLLSERESFVFEKDKKGFFTKHIREKSCLSSENMERFEEEKLER